VFLPQIKVEPLKLFYNQRLINMYLDPQKAKNTTRPFAEKTYAMYPELRGEIDGKSDEDRKLIIDKAVEARLVAAEQDIQQRVLYFQKKFNSFLPGFIKAQCELYNYEWKEYHSVITCYVGYIPFYPRSVTDRWFYVSYNDEERVFSGAVHEINHMIFCEKWKEMNGLKEFREPGFPDPFWLLEEMIVEPTLNDPKVKPHTLYENRAYDQFYTKTVDGKSFIEHLNEMYQDKTDIESFIRQAFDFVETNVSTLV